jgi:glycyl-tRNA synthetase beta chain
MNPSRSIRTARLILTPVGGADLPELIALAVAQHGKNLTVADTAAEVFEFLLGRYRAMYEEQGIGADVIAAVQVCRPGVPADFDRRVKAVAHFRALPEAASLAAANKRVSNILAKEAGAAAGEVSVALLQEPAEKELAHALAAISVEVEPLFAAGDYTAALARLAVLKAAVDTFFDHVMVMADDPQVKANRLRLLANLRALFLRVADVSQLQA